MCVCFRFSIISDILRTYSYKVIKIPHCIINMTISGDYMVSEALKSIDLTNFESHVNILSELTCFRNIEIIVFKYHKFVLKFETSGINRDSHHDPLEDTYSRTSTLYYMLCVICSIYLII